MKENCVKCGKETPYDERNHIDQRLFYVEGAGQLCGLCWRDAYLNDMPLFREDISPDQSLPESTQSGEGLRGQKVTDQKERRKKQAEEDEN
jgi:hypothetical protein